MKMKRLLYLVIGHQRTWVALTSNRFACRRCGLDLGHAGIAPSLPAAATVTHPVRRGRSFPRSHRAGSIPSMHGSAGARATGSGRERAP
jgi:hypothetical protein